MSVKRPRRLAIRLPFFVGAASTLLLASCGGVPRAGPTTGAVISGGGLQKATPGNYGYTLTPLDEATARRLNHSALGAKPPAAPFSALPPPSPVGLIGVGDMLKITLWEPNPTGQTLFNIPGMDTEMTVGPDGDIVLPYIGTIRAADLSPSSLTRTIEYAYASQGHKAQVVVSDGLHSGDQAVVQGDVVKPGAYPIVPHENTLLDLIAIAGGPRDEGPAIKVRVSRDNVEASSTLWAVSHDASQDITLGPGDAVMLSPSNLFFYAFGAVNRPGPNEITRPRETLTQALAALAGLQDNLAAPRGVFIYRMNQTDAPQQVVFQLDLSKPVSFFIADQFIVEPADIIYVSDAPIADLAKILQVIAGMSNIGAAPRNFGAPY